MLSPPTTIMTMVVIAITIMVMVTTVPDQAAFAST